MNPVWLVPMAALLVGGAAVVALGRTAAEEARLFVTELGRQREVAVALGRLHDSLHELGAGLPRSTRR